MIKYYKSNETGRSMVEMLGVLAIIGVLSVGGISGYSKAMTKFKISKSMDQVSMLVANIRTLYSGQKDYTGLNQGTAITYGIIPSEMANGTSSTSTVTNAFAGNVYIGTTASNKQFALTYTGLGQEACVALSTADWGGGSSSGLVGMNIASTAAGAVNVATTYTGTALPVSLATAASVCGCTTATCTVSWIYY